MYRDGTETPMITRFIRALNISRKKENPHTQQEPPSVSPVEDRNEGPPT